MERPGQPHVRIFDGCVYIERAPSAWVQVCETQLWSGLLHHERAYMIEKAVRHGHERELPREVPGQ